MIRSISQTVYALAVCAALSQAAVAADPVTYTFSQEGFGMGGSISGEFRGTDLDGDGKLYTMSSFLASFLGLPPGDEFEYLRITFRDINGKTNTVVYDTSVSDIEDFENIFTGFSYILDGGSIGDDPGEGISLAPFPGTSAYVLGELFRDTINPMPLPDVFLANCGTGDECAAILEYDELGNVVFSDVSSEIVDMRQVYEVAGRTFETLVIASAGFTFPDCFRFDESGNLSIDGLGQTLTFTQSWLDRNARVWLATSRTGDALPIAFQGVAPDATGVRGRAVNEFGDTFAFRGEENPACSVPAQQNTYAHQ